MILLFVTLAKIISPEKKNNMGKTNRQHVLPFHLSFIDKASDIQANESKPKRDFLPTFCEHGRNMLRACSQHVADKRGTRWKQTPDMQEKQNILKGK